MTLVIVSAGSTIQCQHALTNGQVGGYIIQDTEN